MSRFELLRSGARTLRRAAAAALIVTLAACSAGGPSTTVNQPTTPGTTANDYTGPAAANADVQAFKVNLWANIRPSNRCGGCHHEGGQSPMFARSDDVNLAYQAANPLVNFTQPDQSRLVIKVGSGHNCWVSDPKACADTMLTWIKAWVGSGTGSSTGVTLQQPPSQTAQGGKQFPPMATDSSPSFAMTVYPLLHKFCHDCHVSTSAAAQQPYFASDDVNEAYAAAQAKINLDTPTQSRFYVRLHDEFHHCWITTGTTPDCPGSAAAMLKAIQDFAGGIPAGTVDTTALLSKALSLKQGTVASGSNRSEANLVAKYEFKTGTGLTAFDTSGVTPAADLTLSGTVTWVGGWGITIGAGGKAQASTASSMKLSNMIKSTGEYSIEAWVAPANVAQMDAYIVSYSGSDTTRNATLGQHAMQYEGRARSDQTDTNGTPPLLTSATKPFVQAALQHVVLTYDPTNGQKVYVNGNYTGDVDPKKGGSLANWDTTFALVLGNEVTGKEQWLGTIKFVAIHSRALTAAQVQQNYAAGVGERYYLLFDVTDLSGVPQSYIMVEGSQYDSYSYLFNKPTFISLSPSAAPSNLAIKGIRVGLNGNLAKSGQSFATVNATVGGSSYTAASGQLLSSVGAVIAADTGVDTDMFYLSFDTLGTHNHVFAEPAPVTTRLFDNTARPDYGIATFDRVNQSFANITAVPLTNTTVATLYTTQNLRQSLPAAPGIDAFVASNQTAISQLAGAYCGQLVDTQNLRDAFFGTGLDNSLTAMAATFFATQANQDLVVGPLVAKSGAGVNTTIGGAATTEMRALLARFGTDANLKTATVSTATKAACSALLGSAAVTLQ